MRTVRNALVNMIPILMIGAFALTLQTLPITAYQELLNQTQIGRTFLWMLQLVYSGTFSVLSVYMTIMLSYSYIRLKANTEGNIAGTILSAIVCFFILSGAYLPDFSIEYLGPKSMFLALITGIGASALFHWLYQSLNRERTKILSAGADLEFTRAVSTLIPIAVTITTFAILNTSIIRMMDVDSFRMGLSNFSSWLFSFGHTGFLKGFCFVLFSSLLWFFGIHGSDTLENVMHTYFEPGLAANQMAVAAGEAPTTILNKGFFDCFVLMGGCGASICLLIAILTFSKNRAKRKLGYSAALPMLFNINEMMIFGLPVILNPVMFIPFILVPLISYSFAYFASYIGIVPLITNEVAWTTPIIMGGYHATGSIAGSIMQLFNVALGVLIYMPFVKRLDHQSEERFTRNYNTFLEYFKTFEQKLGDIKLTEQNNVYGELAKELCAEMRENLESRVVLGYQPQYNYNGKCVGVEALLRWKHPILGILYPPLMIRLADEGGYLFELERTVLKKVMENYTETLSQFGEHIKISFNITGKTVVQPKFVQFCEEMNEKYKFGDKNLCIEVTEQEALWFDESTVSALNRLHNVGFSLAVDDFSMGQTSIHYLKDNLFDLIKLDGSLIKGMFAHQNSRKIIESIVGLATSLGIAVLAEYVETEQQKEALHKLGCDMYQGYLYSPAVFLNAS